MVHPQLQGSGENFGSKGKSSKRESELQQAPQMVMLPAFLETPFHLWVGCRHVDSNSETKQRQ